MEYPLVSIVTPSYNQGRFIDETIQSVLTQDYPHIEYIVMDGDSTDNTVTILHKYDGKIIWHSEKDRGQTHAINKGFALVQGDIIAWINSDDYYLAGAVRNAVNFFQNNSNVSMVYGEGYHVDEQGKIIERYPTERYNFNRFRETCYICQPTVFLRRAVLDSVGYPDESLRFGMDYDYWIRIGKKHQIAFLPEYLACSRFYPAAKTLHNRVEVHAESLKIMKKHFTEVCSKWVYDYGHAVMEQYLTRDTPFKNWAFATGLCVVSFYKFLEQYGKIPKQDIVKMSRWFAGTGRDYFRSLKGKL